MPQKKIVWMTQIATNSFIRPMCIDKHLRIRVSLSAKEAGLSLTRSREEYVSWCLAQVAVFIVNCSETHDWSVAQDHWGDPILLTV